MTTPALEHRSIPRRIVGRYALFEAIASGGMAAVHLGHLMGPVGFSRTERSAAAAPQATASSVQVPLVKPASHKASSADSLYKRD